MAVFNPRGRDCRYKASVNMPRAFDSGECKKEARTWIFRLGSYFCRIQPWKSLSLM